MGTRARAGTCIGALVRMAVPLLKTAEQKYPRTGPGAKPVLPDWFMAALIMIAVLHRKKTKSAQFRFLSAQRGPLAQWLDYEEFPSRATYFRRYRRAHRLFRGAIRLQGLRALADGVTDARDLVADKSLMAARGPVWHKSDQKADRQRAGVDREAGWGYSEHDAWVYGFSYEVVVTATPQQTVFPLLFSVDRGNTSEQRSFAAKIADLPSSTETVSVDSGYDSNELGERIEWNAQGRRTGRRFLCPENPRNHGRQKRKPGGADASRARSRQRRRQRRAFLESARGRRIYARRKKTVEPFNEWFKALFELEDRVWHRGLENNRTQLAAALFVYQLLVRYNHRCGRRNGQVRWLMDEL
jgi:hypothetical protein